ncbi:MAG: dihydrolipoamide acetyltransferase family protein [Actinomycetota bacterium]
MADIQMPQLGETVTEGTITRWFKQVGDRVEIDEMLFEVSTDKVDSEVPSPAAGFITEIVAPEGETVDVGEVIARVADAPGGDAGAPAAEPAPAPAPAPAPEPAPAPAAAPPPPPPPAPAPAPEPAPAPAPAPPPAPEPAVAPAASGVSPAVEGRLLSPVVRRLINEHGLDPDAIQGTGVGGRITRNDVLAAIDADGAKAAPAAAGPVPAPAPAAAPPPPPPPAPAPAAAPRPPAPAPAVPAPAAAAVPAEAGDRSLIVPFNNIRRRTGEHMVMSLATSPHVLTVMEIDYENVDRVRREHKAAFKQAEGFSLTYLPFQALATVEALNDFPDLNASVEGDHLVVHRDVHLGIAVDLDFQGLIVPVVKNADGKNLRGITREINDLANRARSKSLNMDDIAGGTFTISNNGSYGTYTTAAIINQPQVAVLSTDGIARRPVVVEDRFGNETIAVHSVGHLSLSWDHRAFDGSYAASFLRRIKEIIETRDWEQEL